MKLAHLVWSALAVLSISSYSCTQEYAEDLSGVCFEQDVLPIFQSNCTQSGCHNSQDREDGYDLTSYEKIVSQGIEPGNYKGSEIYKVLVKMGGEDRMPQSPYNRLTDEQITFIALWIEEGANNTTCPDDGTCDTSNVTYSGTVKPLLDKYCNGCHGGSSPQGNINYNTFTGVKATATDGSMMGSIQHASGYSPMPENGNKLSNCNISLIQTWVDAGAPNN
ncbi:MAG: hypothetical protein IT270_02550 [Saprospiraceae bacterium]|nr:hypothetical protein [Saprospiraceae bacterium]